MSKRVLVISNMYPSTEFPHYGIFVKNTNEIIHEAGYEIDGVYIYKTKSTLKKIMNYLLFFLKTIIKLNFKSYDLIYVHYPALSAIPLYFWFAKKNTSLFVNIHGNDLVAEEDKDKKHIKTTLFFLKKASKIIVPSNYFLNILVNDFSFHESKINVYPSGGIDTTLFRPLNTHNHKSELDLESAYKYVGYVNRIEENKGWDTFLKAGKKFLTLRLDYKLIIVGDGNQRKDLDKLVKNLDLEERIIFLPFQNHENLVSLLNCLDFFCFPTRRKSESLGLIGLEAMSCGTLVVGSSLYGPSSYLVDGYNGFSFNPYDVDALFEKMQLIANLDSEKKEELARNALETAEKFSKKNTKKNFLSLFD